MRARKTLAGTIATGALGALLLVPPIAGAAKAPPTDGAPLEAEVRMTSLFGLPPQAYSLVCTSLPSCTTSGAIDLATTAEVPVAYSGGVTKGAAPLPFTTAQGEVSMTFDCGDGTFQSRIVQGGTQAGELEIASVKADAGANTLAVALNHGGVSGGDFPQETINRSDGGCNSPVQNATQQYGQWYAHFYNSHRAEQQATSNDLELKGLAFQDGAFTKTYERFVTFGAGSSTYQAFESTRIEVEPEFCRGARNRISSATAGGESLGLAGSSFYPGQVITAPAKTRLRLGDGSILELEKGGKLHMAECDEDLTEVYLGETIKNFFTEIKKAVAGSEAKFEVTTERAVAGVRGTKFEIDYKAPKQLTRVTVTEGKVSLKGINGAKGKIVIREGEVGVQKGTKPPRIVSG